MTLQQCVKAYVALNTLMDKECDFKTAYAFSKLHAKLKPSVEFFMEKEQELVNEFSAKDSNGNAVMTGNGQFALAPDKNPAEFAKRHAELENVEVGEDTVKLKVSPPESISAANILALEDFLDFVID